MSTLAQVDSSMHCACARSEQAVATLGLASRTPPSVVARPMKLGGVLQPTPTSTHAAHTRPVIRRLLAVALYPDAPLFA
jgi:hypothetical protein